MDKQGTIKELIDQAKNTRHLVYEVAAAYVGVPPERVTISVIGDTQQGQNRVNESWSELERDFLR